MADPTGKVLVVDDDRFVRMALTEALRSWGYDIVEADTVASARKAFETEEPAIVSARYRPA
jgi:DNA-binding response OmpR family regulator